MILPRGSVASHTWHISNYLIINPVSLFWVPGGWGDKITFNQVTAHVLKRFLKDSGMHMNKGVCSDAFDGLKSLTSSHRRSLSSDLRKTFIASVK